MDKTNHHREDKNHLQRAIDRINYFESKYKPHEILGPLCYGYGTLLKQYLGMPQFIPLHITMDHGVYMDDEVYPEQMDSVNPIFVTRTSQAEALWKLHQKPSHVMGNTFVRYRKFNGVAKDLVREGTIAYPAHSTHLIDAVFSIEDYADALLALPATFKPITVCLYWKDLLKGDYQVYLEKNIRVETAGHMADPLFPQNFYKILKGARYTTSNQIGSHTFYSTDIGIPFFKFQRAPKMMNKGGDPSRPKNYVKEFQELSDIFTFDLSGPVTITPEISALTDELLGKKEKVNKQELRWLILKSAYAYRRGRLLPSIGRLLARIKRNLTPSII